MKVAIAIGCLLLAVSSAQGQFVFLQQERSVSAGAELFRTDYLLPGQDLHLVDTPMLVGPSFGPFDETVTANVEEPSAGWVAHGTAWQQSTLSPTEIVATGGPRDVFSCCDFAVNHQAGATSTTRVQFRLSTPTFLGIHVEILDAGDYRPLATLYTSGDVYFSLTGPDLSILHEPNRGMSVGEQIPAILPLIIDETRLVGPGDYELDVWSSYGYGFGTDRTLEEGYYDVRLTATPIREPHGFIALLLALICRPIRRRYVLAHFGK